jgi:hypothetical protein
MAAASATRRCLNCMVVDLLEFDVAPGDSRSAYISAAITPIG